MSPGSREPAVALTNPKYEQSADIEWIAISEAPRLSIDQRVRELIGVTGSLTRRLRELCGGAFQLRLLGERRREQSPSKRS